MAQLHHDEVPRAGEAVKMGIGLEYAAVIAGPKMGSLIFDMWDARTGESIHYFEKETEDQAKEHVRDA